MKRRRSFFPVFLLVGIAWMFLGTGCASTAKFDYSSTPGAKYRSDMVGGLPAITVVPFTDARPAKLLANALTEKEKQFVSAKGLQGGQGTFATGWIPLMPYAWMSTELPEERRITLATLKSFWCRFDRELAEAAVISIRASNCFKEVLFAEEVQNAKTRYVFQGTIHSTKYEGTRITYGLTYLLAPVLWIIGAPDATSQNTLEVTFSILDTQTNKIIWQYRFNGVRSTVQGFYYNVGEDTENYSILMKMGMNAALHDLDVKVKAAKKAGSPEKVSKN